MNAAARRNPFVTVLQAEIYIAAPAERAWAVLSDTSSFPQWNPFLTQISGTLAEGAELTVRMNPLEGSPRTFKSTVTKLRPGRELRWRGRLGVPGLFDGEHAFVLEPLGPTTVHLVHRERFSGLLVPLLARTLRARYLPAFEAMNAAVRVRAEQGAEVSSHARG
jgi:hypothetical protein